MQKQEARGKVKKLQGRVKEAAGIITGNPKLEREGSRQRTEGAVQESVGKARRKVGELVERSRQGDQEVGRAGSRPDRLRRSAARRARESRRTGTLDLLPLTWTERNLPCQRPYRHSCFSS